MRHRPRGSCCWRGPRMSPHRGSGPSRTPCSDPVWDGNRAGSTRGASYTRPASTRCGTRVASAPSVTSDMPRVRTASAGLGSPATRSSRRTPPAGTRRSAIRSWSTMGTCTGCGTPGTVPSRSRLDIPPRQMGPPGHATAAPRSSGAFSPGTARQRARPRSSKSAWSGSSTSTATPGISCTRWDGPGVARPKIVAAAGARRMYYGGAGGPSNWRIGFAVYSPGSAPPSYVSSGYFVSTIVDSSSRNTLWNSIDWRGAVSDSTGIGVSVQVGNTSFPDYSWSSPSAPVFVQGPTLLRLPPARFALVLAALVTLNASVTPVLDQITLTYSLPPPPPPSLWTVSVAGVPLIVLVILLLPSAVVGAILVLFLRYARSSPAVVATSVRCTTCGSVNQPANKFCFRCGRPMLVPLSPPPPPS